MAVAAAPRGVCLRLLASALALLVSVTAREARANAPTPAAAHGRPRGATGGSEAPRAEFDYDSERYEVAGFPIIGGNSHIGLELGAAGALTRFGRGQRPFLWNMDLVLSASVRPGPQGADLAHQWYLWKWDVPGLLGGWLRLTPILSYQHTVNEGYFGLGNASEFDPHANDNGAHGRRYQFINSEARARVHARFRLAGPVSLVVIPSLRRVAPTPYAGSLLEADAAAREPDGSPVIRGTSPLVLPGVAAGLIVDTRDNEIRPSHGIFYQVGMRFTQGLPLSEDVRYGGFSASLAHYVPIAGPVVFASRLVVDVMFGNVPFYDLFRGGLTGVDDMPGGVAGVRGVPVGRLLGRGKAFANFELRSMFAQLTLLRQCFRLGGNVFFDAGRVWNSYGADPRRDGTGLGLHYGVGAGTYVQWGQVAVIRFEVAYSPDAAAENPGLPLGIYVEEGVMF